jgi:hypothetical protein
MKKHGVENDKNILEILLWTGEKHKKIKRMNGGRNFRKNLHDERQAKTPEIELHFELEEELYKEENMKICRKRPKNWFNKFKNERAITPWL